MLLFPPYTISQFCQSAGRRFLMNWNAQFCFGDRGFFRLNTHMHCHFTVPEHGWGVWPMSSLLALLAGIHQKNKREVDLGSTRRERKQYENTWLGLIGAPDLFVKVTSLTERWIGREGFEVIILTGIVGRAAAHFQYPVEVFEDNSEASISRPSFVCSSEQIWTLFALSGGGWVAFS